MAGAVNQKPVAVIVVVEDLPPRIGPPGGAEATRELLAWGATQHGGDLKSRPVGRDRPRDNYHQWAPSPFGTLIVDTLERPGHLVSPAFRNDATTRCSEPVHSLRKAIFLTSVRRAENTLCTPSTTAASGLVARDRTRLNNGPAFGLSRPETRLTRRAAPLPRLDSLIISRDPLAARYPHHELAPQNNTGKEGRSTLRV